MIINPNYASDIGALYESIYFPREEVIELTEEELTIVDLIETVTDYFESYGIDDEELDYIVEDLGIDQFYRSCVTIYEDRLLTEARRGKGGSRVRIKPTTMGGNEITKNRRGLAFIPLRRGEVTHPSIKAKAERKASEEKASSEKKSGLTDFMKMQNAMAGAKTKKVETPKVEPKKTKAPTPNKAFKDRVAGFILKGLERHNKATKSAGEMASATGETLRKIGGAAKDATTHFTKGAIEGGASAIKAGKVAHKLVNSDFDMYDAIMGYLLDEGFAGDEESALVIMTNMSETWLDSIVENLMAE